MDRFPFSLRQIPPLATNSAAPQPPQPLRHCAPVKTAFMASLARLSMPLDERFRPDFLVAFFAALFFVEALVVEALLLLLPARFFVAATFLVAAFLVPFLAPRERADFFVADRPLLDFFAADRFVLFVAIRSS